MNELRAKDVAVFVVWSDQFGAEARHVAEAAALMPDERARHYWDGGRVLGRAYQKLELGGRTLDVGTEAWDVWMLFDRQARWTEAGPPKPVWWEHQLRDMPRQRRLDPQRFAAKATELRARPAKP